MVRGQAITGIAVMLLLTACAASTPPRSGEGTVTGKLVLAGGPLRPGGKQPGERPIPGTIRFSGSHHQVFTAQAGGSGTFSARLPAGTYQVAASSPRVTQVSGSGSPSPQDAPCAQPRLVVVAAGQTTRITLACLVP